MRLDRDPMQAKSRLYFASPLFSVAEKRFNEDVCHVLASYFRVYLPQRDGGLMVEMIERGTPPAVAAKHVFEADFRAIMDCDVLIAVLDGRSVDEGVAFELGLAFANGKVCLGLQTDVRRLLPSGNNPMIGQALSHIFTSVADLLDWLRLNWRMNQLGAKNSIGADLKTRYADHRCPVRGTLSVTSAGQLELDSAVRNGK